MELSQVESDIWLVHVNLLVVALVLADFRAQVVWSSNLGGGKLESAVQNFWHSKVALQNKVKEIWEVSEYYEIKHPQKSLRSEYKE